MKGFGRLSSVLGILIFLVSVNAVVAACPDFDNDNSVGFNDFFLFSQYFNWQVNDTTKVYDVDGNKAIDLDDFFLFSAAFGKKCGELSQAAAQAAETPQIEQPAAVVLPKPDACQQNIEECKKQVSYILAAGSKVAKLEDGKLGYYHSDYLGSVSKITDDSGSVVFSADYLPFGEQMRQEGEERFTYTGKELDEESGLYYYGARYYDAEIGRFTSVDPVLDSGNPYAYVENNPLKLVDPDGKMPAVGGKLNLDSEHKEQLERTSFRQQTVYERAAFKDARAVEYKAERAEMIEGKKALAAAKNAERVLQQAEDPALLKLEMKRKILTGDRIGAAAIAKKLGAGRELIDKILAIKGGLKNLGPQATAALAAQGVQGALKGQKLLNAGVAVHDLVRGDPEKQASAALSLLSSGAQLAAKGAKATPIGVAVGILASPTEIASGDWEQQKIKEYNQMMDAKEREDRRLKSGLAPN